MTKTAFDKLVNEIDKENKKHSKIFKHKEKVEIMDVPEFSLPRNVYKRVKEYKDGM